MSGHTAHLSIHDVKPSELDRVRDLVDRCRGAAGTRVALLVVPGLEWSPGQVDQLREWATEGFELAGHGWVHRGVRPQSFHHRIHALLLSRDQAELLSRGREELVELILGGWRWFKVRDLPAPELYVPPAWALGALSPGDLEALPYRWYEVLAGFLDAGTGRLHPTPLMGYEADTAFRRRALRVTNFLARRAAGASRRPLRIGLHPRDLDLLLAEDLLGDLGDPRWRFLTTAEAMAVLSRRESVAATGHRVAQRATE